MVKFAAVPTFLYSDWLRAGRSGDWILLGARFSAPVQTGPGAHPASCTVGTGSFLGVKSGRGVTLTLLVPWSRKSKAIHLLSIWAVQPVQYSYTSTPPMGRTACTEPQCLYKGAIYLFYTTTGISHLQTRLTVSSAQEQKMYLFSYTHHIIATYGWVAVKLHAFITAILPHEEVPLYPSTKRTENTPERIDVPKPGWTVWRRPVRSLSRDAHSILLPGKKTTRAIPACHLFLSWSTSIQSTTTQLISLRSTFIFTQFCLGLPNSPFPSRFQTKSPNCKFRFYPHTCYTPSPSYFFYNSDYVCSGV